MIDQIGLSLVELLKKNLLDILPKSGQIGIYLPQERGEIALGLYLYSVQSCNEVNAPAIASLGRNIKAVPPRFLTLYYLMTAYSNAELSFRAEEEHRILARGMEVFENTPLLAQKELGFKPGVWVDELKLQFVNLDTSEMSGIWNNKDIPYRLSAAYKVCPVELSVVKGKISQRIGEANTSIKDK